MDALKAEIERKRKMVEVVSTSKIGGLKFVYQKDIHEAEDIERAARYEEEVSKRIKREEANKMNMEKLAAQNKPSSINKVIKVGNPVVDTTKVEVLENQVASNFAEENNNPGDADDKVPDNDDDENVVFYLKYTNKGKCIAKYFKSLLRRWELQLSMRETESKLSAKGKLEVQSYQRCKDYLKPFFKICVKSPESLPEGILNNVWEMVKSCEDKNFVEAHDWYIKTAIGNAAWPIGVTMVGIHERTARDKITKVAHVMNNEAERKYLTSIKRLMSFAQSLYPELSPSMKVL